MHLPPPQFLADQLTLLEPGADYALHITTAPQIFGRCGVSVMNYDILSIQMMFVTGHGTSSAKYRPEFLDHFDQKEKEKASEQSNDATGAPENPTGEIEQSQPDVNSPAAQALQKQLQQIAGGQPVLQNVAVASASNNTNNPSKFQQCIAEGDLEFVSEHI